MARVGRGRSRGGRILDIPSLVTSHRGMGHGRIMIGRGTSIIPMASPKEDPSNYLETNEGNHADLEEEAKKSLEEQLLNFSETEKVCFIQMTIDYFEFNSDVQYYIDKIMEALLKSSFLIEKFTMCYKLLTLLKTHGDKIKLAMFTKLQTTFQDMQLFMNESRSLSPIERLNLCNFCELLGQLYFRFRLHIDSLERYNILAEPAIQCMTYLVKACGLQELQVLVKLMMYNYSAMYELHQQAMTQLTLDIRTVITEKTDDKLVITGLLCAVDIANFQDSELPQHLVQFYSKKLGSAWIPESSHVQMLAAVPLDIAQTQMDRFNVLLEEYNKNRFVAL